MSKPSKKETLGSLVGRTAKVMSRHLLEQFRLAGHEMNRDHFFVMVHLWEEDGLTHFALGDRCGSDKTATTRAIDTLEKKNYVVRVPDQLDRRQKRVFLTHEGKQIQSELMALGHESLKHVTRGVDEGELAICQKVLRQLRSNLKEYM